MDFMGLTYQPSIQNSPLGARWYLFAFEDFDVIVMYIRRTIFLVRVTKLPPFMCCIIQPVFCGNVFVHFQCIEEVREVNFWISFMPVLRNLLSWEQGHIVSLEPGRVNPTNLRPGTLPSVWLRIYGHAKTKAGMWLSQDIPDQSAVRDTGYNYILQILSMMERGWVGWSVGGSNQSNLRTRSTPTVKRVGGYQAGKGRRGGERGPSQSNE